VGHLFMFLVGGKTPDQSVHLNLTTTMFSFSAAFALLINLFRGKTFFCRLISFCAAGGRMNAFSLRW
ncbi:hypothetical protein R1K36_19765, partial [Klebsiella sp. 97683]